MINNSVSHWYTIQGNILTYLFKVPAYSKWLARLLLLQQLLTRHPRGRAEARLADQLPRLPQRTAQLGHWQQPRTPRQLPPSLLLDAAPPPVESAAAGLSCPCLTPEAAADLRHRHLWLTSWQMTGLQQEQDLINGKKCYLLTTLQSNTRYKL